MKINEKFIKISGSWPIDKEMIIDQMVDVKIAGDVVKIEERSKQDGTKDVYYVVKISDLLGIDKSN